MTYRRWMAARQLLTEEFLGVHLRQVVHQEDQTFKNAADKLSRR